MCFCYNDYPKCFKKKFQTPLQCLCFFFRDGEIISEVRETAEFSFTSSIVQSLDEGSEEETDDARSTSQLASDTQSSVQSDIQSRHVQFRSGSGTTRHTAM